MDIVFNINHLGLEGMGPTLTSLIRNCSAPQKLKLWFIYTDFEPGDQENILKLLVGEGYTQKPEFVYFDAKAIFGHLLSLQGDWTAYGRLLIPRTVKSDTALYLDADLIILSDVLTLENFDFGDKPYAAVHGSAVKWCLEKDFFIENQGWDPETPYFNSGVVLFNIKRWNELDIDTAIDELTKEHGILLRSHDQTLLNLYIKGQFAILPDIYNVPWYPASQRPENSEKAILHFVGSPKPWDISGSLVHFGYKVWASYNTPFWKKTYGKYSKVKFERTWNIRRSIIRSLKKKLKN
ncbi:glycosyltransferase family 8 protein [Mucilaginibacter terrae]|uniref:Lipopolysaccharide biosynthesis glycosyltransferase n=1 Tax=Mucilaginibacter terrae TaxID=1955052 RepID=A0ABU3GST8_9SPHI|nr:glycosyltransferase [Mucilaginibacter terrae]MDT3402839.1 lipopolysaccharide biosynthesis glycosyltransferase [Mucilaginibacter terrae]